jgi:hypothetical protein
MTPTPYYLDTLYRCTKKDWDLYQRWTDFLPRRAEGEPYHSGPHSLQRFRMVWELVRPKSVLEIGFNLGHSAVMWLELGVQKVISIQPTPDEGTIHAQTAMEGRYTHRRHRLLQGDSRAEVADRMLSDFIGTGYDLISVDGSHERSWVESDIALGKRLACPYFLMDDYDSHHGPGVVDAVKEAGLIPLAIFGTMALCVPEARYTQRADPLGANYYERIR